jgi:hypothetical protein
MKICHHDKLATHRALLTFDLRYTSPIGSKSSWPRMNYTARFCLHELCVEYGHGVSEVRVCLTLFLFKDILLMFI